MSRRPSKSIPTEGPRVSFHFFRLPLCTLTDSSSKSGKFLPEFLSTHAMVGPDAHGFQRHSGEKARGSKCLPGGSLEMLEYRIEVRPRDAFRIAGCAEQFVRLCAERSSRGLIQVSENAVQDAGIVATAR